MTERLCFWERVLPKLSLLLALLVLPAPGSAGAQSSDAGAATGASLQSVHRHLAWLVGTWEGEGLGGQTEEIWLPARGGQMMGLFRMVADDQVRFSEILAIGEWDGKVELRLKHFGSDLHGWEEKDQVTIFPFESAKKGQVVFSGLQFIQDGSEGLRIEVQIEEQGEKANTAIFRFKRAPR